MADAHVKRSSGFASIHTHWNGFRVRSTTHVRGVGSLKLKPVSPSTGLRANKCRNQTISLGDALGHLLSASLVLWEYFNSYRADERRCWFSCLSKFFSLLQIGARKQVICVGEEQPEPCQRWIDESLCVFRSANSFGMIRCVNVL